MTPSSSAARARYEGPHLAGMALWPTSLVPRAARTLRSQRTQVLVLATRRGQSCLPSGQVSKRFVRRCHRRSKLCAEINRNPRCTPCSGTTRINTQRLTAPSSISVMSSWTGCERRMAWPRLTLQTSTLLCLRFTPGMSSWLSSAVLISSQSIWSATRAVTRRACMRRQHRSSLIERWQWQAPSLSRT